MFSLSFSFDFPHVSFFLPFHLHLLSPSSPCCCWHCRFPAQVEQCTSPPSFRLNDLTSSSDRPLLPSPPLPSPLPPFHHPSSLHLFPLCFLFHIHLLHIALSHLAFLITLGPFPRASVWSPWWLKGCSKAASCCVKVKVFHQRILPLSGFSGVWSAAGYVHQRCWLLRFPPIFPPLTSHLFLSKEHIFEVNVSKRRSCSSEFPLQAEIRFFPPLLASIIRNPFIFWWLLTVAGADNYWNPLRLWWESSRAMLALLDAASICCWDSEWTWGGGLWLSTMSPLGIQLGAPLSPVYEILSPRQTVQTPFVFRF